MAEINKTKEVCKICFNASSQKSTPTLIPESRVVTDSSNKKRCPNCKQNWSSQKVAFDTDTNRWVAIRQRPTKMNPNIDYQMCSSVQKRTICNKGPGLCTFAHSRIELIMWSQERWREPRPLPTLGGANQFTLCKHVLTTGNCPYGQRCSFAHSEEELDHWVKSITGTKTSSFPDGNVPDFYCSACDVSCTGQRQYEEHLSGGRHRQVVSSQQQAMAKDQHYGSHYTPTMPPGKAEGSGRIRPRPNRLPVQGFKMCFSVQHHRRCYYGNKCTFAHSQAELDKWNSERMSLRQARFAAGPVKITPAKPVHEQPTQSGLDDFEADSHTTSSSLPMEAASGEPEDFAQQLRTTVMLDYQEKDDDKDLKGLEKTLQNVTITEETGQNETQTVLDNGPNISWIFQVSSNIVRTLHSVVLFDVLSPDFTIDSMELVKYNGQRTSLLPSARASQGEGIQVSQVINPPDKIVIKIGLKPRTGLLGQIVLFDFGSFYMLRCLSIHVINEQDRRTLTSTQKKVRRRPEKIDLFWDQHYEVIPWTKDDDDMLLDEYSLPEAVENLIDAGKYKNVEQKVKKPTYGRRMHNLLYLEEYQQRKGFSRYDLYDVDIDVKDRLETETEWINNPHYSFVTIEMDEILFEGGRSIRPTDLALLLPSNQRMAYECVVHAVQRDSVILKLTKEAHSACLSSRNRCSIRFSPSRTPMRTMHQAVDSVDLDVIFPDEQQDLPIPNSNSISRCLNELEGLVLNNQQKNAVRSVIEPLYQEMPTLILGPFGCGKTRTVFECVTLLTLYVPDVHILICTHTNAAADIYVEAIHNEWIKRTNRRPNMYRQIYKERRVNTVSSIVRDYCNIVDGSFNDLRPSEVMSKSIVVTTTMTSRSLWLNGIEKGFFTYIFIDEAAQVFEAELLIPLCLAGKNTKIVLAGDTMQMDPPVSSPIAKRYGLHVSLLERLYDDDLYKSGKGLHCRSHLTENHRSHEKILHLPSKLFYEDKLIAKAQFPPDGPKHIPALQFVGVDGQERQDESSPSYSNNDEVFKIAEEVTRLHNDGRGLQQRDICVLSYYRMQTQIIRSHLRSKRLGQVQAHNIDAVQGKEYRALVISTVRTCDPGQEDTDEGFLNNIKLFNTAITRAREWLIVVGEPITLCTVGYNSLCWMEFIKTCIEMNTFRYPRSELFMNFLETKLVARRIRQKQHKDFIEKSTAPVTANVVIGPPTSQSNDIRPVTQQMSALSLQQQQQVKERVLQLMQNQDNEIATKITDEVLKLQPAQLISFNSSNDIAVKYVREMEAVYKRGGPTSVLMQNDRLQPPAATSTNSTQLKPGVNATSSNVANMMGDLPSFLKNQVDSLTSHLRFCENQQSSQRLSAEMSKNLQDQRSLLLKQMNLVNEQILKYREYIKLSQSPQSSSVTVQPQPEPKEPTIKAPVMTETNVKDIPPSTVPNYTTRQPAVNQQHLVTTGATIMGGRDTVHNPLPPQQHPQHINPIMQPPVGGIPSYGHPQPTGLPGHPHQIQMMTNPHSHMSHLHHQMTHGYSGMGPNRYGPGVVNAMAMPTMRQPVLRHQLMYSPVQQIQGSPIMSMHHTQPMASQPVSQTVQLISPLNEVPNHSTKTWDSDDDID